MKLSETDERDDLLPLLATEAYRDTLSELRTKADDVTPFAALTSDDSIRPSSGETAVTAIRRQVILPRLADAGLIHSDPEDRTVRYRNNGPVETRVGRLQQGDG